MTEAFTWNAQITEFEQISQGLNMCQKSATEIMLKVEIQEKIFMQITNVVSEADILLHFTKHYFATLIGAYKDLQCFRDGELCDERQILQQNVEVHPSQINSFYDSNGIDNSRDIPLNVFSVHGYKFVQDELIGFMEAEYNEIKKINVSFLFSSDKLSIICYQNRQVLKMF